MNRHYLLWTALIVLAAAWPALAPTAGAGEFDRRFEFDGEELRIVNLIGEIRVLPADGGRFEVEVNVRGDDADEEVLEFLVEEGSQASLVIAFPLDEECDYVYPSLGRRGSTSFSPPGRKGRSGLSDLLGLTGGRCRQVKVRGRGRGLEVWADVTVKVPRGRELGVWHGVGEITASRIEGNLLLDVCSGGVEAETVRGDLSIDTGSGGVRVKDVEGELRVDTGSGGVDVADCRGPHVNIDTGSGGVDVEGVDCEDLTIDTGSGGVDAFAIGADELLIDTGSGSVTLELVRMGDGQFKVDTGSGSIEVRLPEGASARVTADSGSGSVSADLGDGRVRRKHRASFTIGDGDARVILDTGSGSIRIRD